MTQPYPFTYTVDTQHANASAAKRLRSNGLSGNILSGHEAIDWDCACLRVRNPRCAGQNGKELRVMHGAVK